MRFEIKEELPKTNNYKRIMNNTQNKKIGQITEDTFIVGIDTGSATHYVKAFYWRSILEANCL